LDGNMGFAVNNMGADACIRVDIPVALSNTININCINVIRAIFLLPGNKQITEVWFKTLIT
jgi:hypothetical protein